MKWNQKGTGLLLITSTDVDQTGVSYYGKQALHFMTIKGDSYAVQLSMSFLGSPSEKVHFRCRFSYRNNIPIHF